MATIPAIKTSGAGGLSDPDLERLTQAIGRELIAAMRRQPERPAEWLEDRFIAAIAEDARLRNGLLRFVDVLPALDFDRGGDLTTRLAREYLRDPLLTTPQPFRSLSALALRAPAPPALVRAAALRATTLVANRLIVEPRADAASGALEALARLRRHGFYPSFDVLGEHVVGEEEAAAYLQRYLRLIGQLGRQPGAGQATPGGVRALQVSAKLSALTPRFDPVDPPGTLARLRVPFGAILDAATRAGVAVTVDMEEYRLRDLTWSIFQEMFGPGGPHAEWPDAGIVLQAYLADAPQQAAAYVAFARRRGVPFQVRLVKGAYWDYESIVAAAEGWPAPVLGVKAATDAQYERLTQTLAAAYPALRLAVGSHNLRSHARAEAVRRSLDLPEQAIEYQTLYGMAPHIGRALRAMGWTVREYVPVGELLAGMSYLVRRILENSSQTGFLLQSRRGARAADLLRSPQRQIERQAVAVAPAAIPQTTLRRVPGGTDEHGVPGGPQSISLAADRSRGQPDAQPPPVLGQLARPSSLREAVPFHNTPPVRLFLAAERERFVGALRRAADEAPRRFTLDLPANPERPWLRPPDASRPDPQRPSVEVEAVTGADVPVALQRLTNACEGWSNRPLVERAAILQRAAQMLLQRRDEIAAAIVLEGGKNWSNALADVDEAADYLRYYPWVGGRLGERFERLYRPRGVVAVIPPWNFPLAIPCGMTAAALLTGNVVALKPAEQTPGITARLVAILHEAGVPRDALAHLPGEGEAVGGALVRSPLVAMIAFTGSRDVGLWIAETAAATPPEDGLKQVLVEMGGKNAIAVFADADMDEAVEGILLSTFGHANQKCSACSRVFAHQAIYARLRRRLAEGARSLPIGPATAPGTAINPLIDAAAVRRVRQMADVARREGKVVLDRLEAPDAAGPNCLGPLLVELAPEALPNAQTAQEEIFGPVLALASFRDEAEALAQINGVAYGLTAGIYSRSPGTIRRMTERIRAGNIYVNREITGARVGVEPFGGMGLSGSGPKAGGEDYLYAFVHRRDGYRRAWAGPPRSLIAGEFPAVRRWTAPFRRRLSMLDAAARLLETGRSGTPSGLVGALAAILSQSGEIARQMPTIPLPGQQTVLDWSLARGVGLVVLDETAPPASLGYLAAAVLLAGNGMTLAIPEVLGRAAEVLLAALRRAGVPPTVSSLLPPGPPPTDLPAGVFDFIAADVALEPAQRLAAALARHHPGQRSVPPFLSMTDAPAPTEPGFLRRFTIPRTIAVRTLRHGADLAL